MSEEVLLQQTQATESESESVATFWVASSQLFSTILYILPYGKANNELVTSFLTIYDCAGSVINRVRLECKASAVQRIDLDMLLGSCKVESGMRHASVVVRSLASTKFVCCFEQGGHQAFIGELQHFSSECPCFIPITFSQKMACFIPIVNFGKTRANLKLRLFVGNKTRDLELELLPNATHLLCPDLAWQDVFELTSEDEKKVCYLRITTRSEELLGVQQIDCAYVNDNIEYSSIC